MIDIYTANIHTVQYNIHIICNRNVFTNCLPCSHTINITNETCLVTCAVSLTFATYMHGLCMYSFSFDPPLDQDTSMYICSHYCIGSSLSLSFYYIIGLGVGVPLVPGTGEVTVQDLHLSGVFHRTTHMPAKE